MRLEGHEGPQGLVSIISLGPQGALDTRLFYLGMPWALPSTIGVHLRRA
jgi:hypothetical protein